MSSIIPHLWFDFQAREATAWYTSLFPNSHITSVKKIKGTPSGDCDLISFTLMGHEFQAISAGPYFTHNPSQSFSVRFDPVRNEHATTELTTLWNSLSEQGNVLMPLQPYDFSELYGWVQDKYGISWQLILTNETDEQRPALMPTLMFTGENAGKAQQALDFYTSVFRDSEQGTIARYPAGMEYDTEGTIMYSDLKLEDTWFVLMDSAYPHGFQFNEAVSYMVMCDTQEEIDYYWERLSAVPESEQCGWLKDQFGVSWQIVPRALGEVMSSKDQHEVNAVIQRLLSMKKIILADLL